MLKQELLLGNKCLKVEFDPKEKKMRFFLKKQTDPPFYWKNSYNYKRFISRDENWGKFDNMMEIYEFIETTIQKELLKFEKDEDDYFVVFQTKHSKKYFKILMKPDLSKNKKHESESDDQDEDKFENKRKEPLKKKHEEEGSDDEENENSKPKKKMTQQKEEPKKNFKKEEILSEEEDAKTKIHKKLTNHKEIPKKSPKKSETEEEDVEKNEQKTNKSKKSPKKTETEEEDVEKNEKKTKKSKKSPKKSEIEEEDIEKNEKKTKKSKKSPKKTETEEEDVEKNEKKTKKYKEEEKDEFKKHSEKKKIKVKDVEEDFERDDESEVQSEVTKDEQKLLDLFLKNSLCLFGYNDFLQIIDEELDCEKFSQYIDIDEKGVLNNLMPYIIDYTKRKTNLAKIKEVLMEFTKANKNTPYKFNKLSQRNLIEFALQTSELKVKCSIGYCLMEMSNYIPLTYWKYDYKAKSLKLIFEFPLLYSINFIPKIIILNMGLQSNLGKTEFLSEVFPIEVKKLNLNKNGILRKNTIDLYIHQNYYIIDHNDPNFGDISFSEAFNKIITFCSFILFHIRADKVKTFKNDLQKSKFSFKNTNILIIIRDAKEDLLGQISLENLKSQGNIVECLQIDNLKENRNLRNKQKN